MRFSQRRRIEKDLPARFRGRSGYKRMLRAQTLRVSVSGIRGKSALTWMAMQALRERGLSVYAKQTGTEPKSIKDGVVHPIERDPRKTAVLGETYWEVKRHWPFEAMVLENQAITPYTMRVFNTLYARPNYLFVTNIRRDHMGDIARRLPAMAKAFVRSAPRGCTLVSGERDPDLKKVMRKTAKRRGVRFIDASPGSLVVPGYEAVTILDAMLEDWFGEGLNEPEKAEHLRSLQERFKWRPSALPGVRWFPGGEINDVDSTRLVLDYLHYHDPRPVTFVGYLRRDRPDRSASFVSFLRDVLERGPAERVILVGHRARPMARRLAQWRDRVHRLPDRPESVRTALRIVAEKSPGGAVMTIINAVPPWPRAFEQAMAGHPHDAAAEAAGATAAGRRSIPQASGPVRAPQAVLPLARPALRFREVVP